MGKAMRYDEQELILTMVAEARKQWLYTQKMFEEVTEPDLIDQLIYEMQAAERRYAHLLKKAREDKARGFIEPLTRR
ncbi:MAG: DUF2508 family protein [Clostridia bacterium]|nr:DUF2508 family protein [Clostridia bacterium]